MKHSSSPSIGSPARAGLLSLLFFFCPSLLHAAPGILVQLINNRAGRIETASVKRYGERIYVTGAVARPDHPVASAHLHVEIAGRDGRTVSDRTVPLSFTGRPSLVRTARYATAFDSSEVAAGSTIRLSFREEPHAHPRKAGNPS